jgi:hypothetical protein
LSNWAAFSIEKSYEILVYSRGRACTVSQFTHFAMLRLNADLLSNGFLWEHRNIIHPPISYIFMVLGEAVIK